MATSEQVELYCEQKEQEKVLKKSIAKLNEDIKSSLIAENKNDMTSGKYTVQLEIRTSEDVNTEKMLSILKQFWQKNHGDEKCPFIRTVEYVDMDELEAFMYQEELPKEVILDLDTCRIKKTTTALTYKIKKGD